MIHVLITIIKGGFIKKKKKKEKVLSNDQELLVGEIQIKTWQK